MTFMARAGHWLILALAAAAWVLDRERLISDQMMGTIQVATLALGGGKVAALFHAGAVAKAESVIKTAQADADAVAKRAEQVSKLVSDVLAGIKAIQSSTASDATTVRPS